MSGEDKGKTRNTGAHRSRAGRFEDAPYQGDGEVIAPFPTMPPPPTAEYLPIGEDGETLVNKIDRLFIPPTPSVTAVADEPPEAEAPAETVASAIRTRQKSVKANQSWWGRQSVGVRFILIFLPALMVIYFLAITVILVLSTRSVTPVTTVIGGTPQATNTLPAYLIKPTLPGGSNASTAPALVPTVTPLPTPTLLPSPNASPIVTVTVVPATIPAANTSSAPVLATTAPLATATNSPLITVTATAVPLNPTSTPTINAVTIAPTTAPPPPTVAATPTINAVTLAPTAATTPRG